MNKLEMLNEDEQKSVKIMAKQMGVSVDQLLSDYDDPKKLVENIRTGNYQVLKEN